MVILVPDLRSARQRVRVSLPSPRMQACAGILIHLPLLCHVYFALFGGCCALKQKPHLLIHASELLPKAEMADRSSDASQRAA